MEEVQSWWEVPAIAHFCSVFRTTFNLIYFDVGELEAAILDMQDPEVSISLEQLITKLLQGCYDDGEVTNLNWEEKLNELLKENSDDDKSAMEGTSFLSLNARTKVEILLELCQIRLDIAAVEDKIKDMPAENMQAKCIGQNSENYSYWYFGDERLYKESSLLIGKSLTPEKGKKTGNRSMKNGIRKTARDKKNDSSSQSSSSWSIVCHNLNDWEKLAIKLSKSKCPSEKALANEIKDDYLSKVSAIIVEKERLLRKRYIELAPKRTSSRISKVQAQRKLEEQRIAEAEEKRRMEYEAALAKREAQKKILEKDERRKRAEERSKIIEERAQRAQSRMMMKSNFVCDYANCDDSDEDDYQNNSDNSFPRTRYSSNKKDSPSDSEKSEESDGNAESMNDSDKSESMNDSDCDKSEKQLSSEDENCGSDSDDSAARSNDNTENEDSVYVNNVDNNHYSQKEVLHTYDLTKWHSTIDPQGQKLHILRSPSNDVSDVKRIRINEAGSYKVTSLNGYNSTPHKEKQNYTPFQMQNLRTYSSTHQGVLRVVKFPNEQVSS